MRSVGQMVKGHKHRRLYPIKTEANMATQNLTVLNAQNNTEYILLKFKTFLF